MPLEPSLESARIGLNPDRYAVPTSTTAPHEAVVPETVADAVCKAPLFALSRYQIAVTLEPSAETATVAAWAIRPLEFRVETAPHVAELPEIVAEAASTMYPPL
jgi:hypothetical protein